MATRNHTTTTDNNALPNSKTSHSAPSFLYLPAEIRAKIYEYLLTLHDMNISNTRLYDKTRLGPNWIYKDEIPVYFDDRDNYCYLHSIPTTLLRANICRICYNEATIILYSTNTFRLWNYWRYRNMLTSTVNRNLEQNPYRMIRRVSVSLDDVVEVLLGTWHADSRFPVKGLLSTEMQQNRSGLICGLK